MTGLAVEVGSLDLVTRAGYEEAACARLHFDQVARVDGNVRTDAVLVARLDGDEQQFEFSVADTEIRRHENIVEVSCREYVE